MNRDRATTRHRTTPCPTCGAMLNASTNAELQETGPVPGDATLCLYCATLLLFDDDLTLRVLTTEEEAALTLDDHQRLAAARAALKLLR